jgi:hypothetical protein
MLGNNIALTDEREREREREREVYGGEVKASLTLAAVLLSLSLSLSLSFSLSLSALAPFPFLSAVVPTIKQKKKPTARRTLQKYVDFEGKKSSKKPPKL